MGDVGVEGELDSGVEDGVVDREGAEDEDGEEESEDEKEGVGEGHGDAARSWRRLSRILSSNRESSSGKMGRSKPLQDLMG